MSSGVKVEYGAYAIGAKESFQGTMTRKADVSDSETILNEDGIAFKPYSNPCELYSTLLDGSTEPLVLGENPIGLWSEICDENGDFGGEAVQLTMVADAFFTSEGITVTFDAANWVFPTVALVEWYRDDELLASKTFQEINSTEYFFENRVERYNKVVLSFSGMNLPYNRLKIRSIEFGTKITFGGDELTNVSIIQQEHPISVELYINTCDFSILSKTVKDFSFERKQPLRVLMNDNLVAKTFITSATRKSARVWNVSAEDYIGFLADTPYKGGIYSGANACELIEDIFAVAKVPVSISEDLGEKTVTGYIPYSNCRDALLQIALAIGAVVDTSYSDEVVVYALTDDVSQTVEKARIMQGQTISDASRVTAVEVMSHSYAKGTETITAYESESSGSGDGILVVFTEPLYDLTITNGEILESGNNYAQINANENCVLSGKKYVHTSSVKRRENPLTLASDTENVVSVQSATLVSKDNVDSVLDMCYNYYTSPGTINANIVERRTDTPIKVGDEIAVETEYSGTLSGRVVRQSFALVGGIVIKNTEVQR